MPDEHLPREAKHDFAKRVRHAWRDRDRSHEQWDREMLGVTAGLRVRIELRDGRTIDGVVKMLPWSSEWWRPEEDMGRITMEPGDVEVAIDDVVAISPYPDKDYTHDSDRPGHEV